MEKPGKRWLLVIIITLIAISLIFANLALRDDYLIWHDEFDGNHLDIEKWGYRDLGERRDAINIEDAITVDNGCLKISTYRLDNQTYTGMIGTMGLFEQTYGFFECRVQFQTQVGHWSAFWLQSQTFGETIGNTTSSGAEIDIFEYRTEYPDMIQHTIHWDGYGVEHKVLAEYPTISNLSTGWHIVGLEWTADEYVFYVDGIETWRINEGVSGAPQYIILSLEVGEWAGDIGNAALPDFILFDYVRVYTEKPDNY